MIDPNEEIRRRQRGRALVMAVLLAVLLIERGWGGLIARLAA